MRPRRTLTRPTPIPERPTEGAKPPCCGLEEPKRQSRQHDFQIAHVLEAAIERHARQSRHGIRRPQHVLVRCDRRLEPELRGNGKIPRPTACGITVWKTEMAARASQL